MLSSEQRVANRFAFKLQGQGLRPFQFVAIAAHPTAIRTVPAFLPIFASFFPQTIPPRELMSTYIVNPVEVRMEESSKGSIYRSIVAMGMRSRQINDQIKTQLTERMADVIVDTDEAEGPNYDQIAISREFDLIPKPTFLAMKEMVDGQITVRDGEVPAA